MTHALLERPLHVVNQASLYELSALLHDEVCRVDDAVWDRATETLTLPVRRQFHGGAEVLLSTGPDTAIYEKDWMRSEVLIRAVIHWEKLDDQALGDYSFNEWFFEAPTIRIAFCQSLVVLISVRELDITMTDLGFRGKARLERGLNGGGEISTSEIY